MYRRNADESLREIERRAAAGDLDSQVSLLQWRLRVGATTSTRLQIAGALGNEAAKHLVQPCSFPPPSVGLLWPQFGGRHNSYKLIREKLPILSVEEFIALAENLIQLMKLWISQYPQTEQGRIWDAPNYMLDHIAITEVLLNGIRRGQSYDAGQLLSTREAMVRWWVEYEHCVRVLALHQLNITQLPELTDELFGTWHHEFLQGLMPWLLGSPSC